MKFEKKHWIMLIVGVVVLYLVWYFLIKKKKTESNYGEANSFPMIGKGEFSPLPMYNQDTAAAINESGYNFRNFGGAAVQQKLSGGPVTKTASTKECCTARNEYGDCTNWKQVPQMVPCPNVKKGGSSSIL